MKSKTMECIQANLRWRSAVTAVSIAAFSLNLCEVSGFVGSSHVPFINSARRSKYPTIPLIRNNFNVPTHFSLNMMKVEDRFDKLEDDEELVLAFVDVNGEKSIDCYVDSYATVEGIEYTIGTPCDYAVALCYFEGEGNLVPIELDDPLMDDIFPVAEGIIEDEFGEELVLLRTPQTLTLVGELEEDDEDDDAEDELDDQMEESEEVEILLSFEEDGREYHLVKLLDPILLVGKGGNENTRTLLTLEESDVIMPKLEKMFLNHQGEEQ